MTARLVDFEEEWFHWDKKPYKVGFWNNWSKKGALSATLTLPSNESKVLLVMITLFVSVVGGYTWNVICFVVHQLLSTHKGRDGLYHQRQVVLRNAQNPVSTLWYLIKLGCSWKSNTRRAVRRQLPFVLLAFAHIACFTIGSIASIQIASVGNSALLRSMGCGFFVDEIPLPMQSKMETERRRQLQRSAEYVRSCYMRGASDSNSTCRRLPVRKLPTKLETGVPCPFNPPSLCRNSTRGTIKMQTETLNSHEHFGINSRVGDRVEYRKFSVCTPLPLTEAPKYAIERPTNFTDELFRNYTYLDLKYTTPGIPVLYDKLRRSLGNRQPYWFTVFPSFPGATVDESALNKTLNNTTYTVVQPVEELRLRDADVTVAILDINALYMEPSNDILLGTRGFVPKEDCGCNNLPLGAKGSWKAQPISAFACSERYQFCNPTSKQCTRQDALLNIVEQKQNKIDFKVKQNMGFNPSQQAIVSLIAGLAIAFNYHSTLRSIGGTAMLAQDKLIEGAGTMSLKVEPNQTEIEFENWFHIQMAAMQHGFMEQMDLGNEFMAYWQQTKDPNWQNLCKSQLIYHPDAVSFSVLGLALTLALGCFLILTALLLEPLVRWWRRRTTQDSYKQLEWDAGELLHMQRMVYESSGQGTWSEGYTLVPTTEKGEVLVSPLGAVDGSALKSVRP
ncbi:hypothetical protein DM02DRAFT_603124 [Periconia macrospinosa]|uniref:Uncharacterized protein n=1 Tax=Periconia macrospinosa TaxID=97972 RepID=A0A2V1D920_9PLEO|nr:hypothetical protein DM02DRAFT_603124 [Periconia macrospinosa]